MHNRKLKCSVRAAGILARTKFAYQYVCGVAVSHGCIHLIITHAPSSAEHCEHTRLTPKTRNSDKCSWPSMSSATVSLLQFAATNAGVYVQEYALWRRTLHWPQRPSRSMACCCSRGGHVREREKHIRLGGEVAISKKEELTLVLAWFMLRKPINQRHLNEDDMLTTFLALEKI